MKWMCRFFFISFSRFIFLFRETDLIRLYRWDCLFFGFGWNYLWRGFGVRCGVGFVEMEFGVFLI